MATILQGRPVPPELMPLSEGVYQSFLAQVLVAREVQQARELLGRLSPDWAVLSSEQKLSGFDRLQDILFSELIPKPQCTLTFSRVRYAATFHQTEWAIKFSENYFQKPLAPVFKTWIHESYHGLLHFLSLRLNPQSAVEVIKPPAQIAELARQYPLSDDGSAVALIAGRNLLGMLDRYLTYRERDWGALDSYYLNVEIIVEDLTVRTFRALLPSSAHRRSYPTAETYIQRRLSGVPPARAVEG